jgi:hypothetical protein
MLYILHPKFKIQKCSSECYLQLDKIVWSNMPSYQYYVKGEANYSKLSEVEVTYKIVISFEFILILHLMKEMREITNILC